MNSFIAIEPKIDIESDLVVFLYYWRIIYILVPWYNRYKILNLFSDSLRASHFIRFSRLCAFFFLSLFTRHIGVSSCSYVVVEFSSHLSFVVLRSPFTVHHFVVVSSILLSFTICVRSSIGVALFCSRSCFAPPKFLPNADHNSS